MQPNIKTHSYDITRNTSPGRSAPRYIVLHYTATSGATAKNEVDYFGKNPAATNASADFFVDGGEIFQYNTQLDSRYSWAVGVDYSGGRAPYHGKCTNANSISIEMCCAQGSDGRWRISDAAYENAVALTRCLMERYKIPAGSVIRHFDVCGKLCPNAVGWLAAAGSEETWSKFKKALASAAVRAPESKDKKVNTPIYRVRRSADEAKTQLGAYAVLSNAKRQADENPGYSVYDMSGKCVYTPKSASGKKPLDDIAREVIRGKWGNGNTRKYRLIEAGYDFDAVQKRVNELLR